MSQERHLAWSCHLPKVRASMSGAGSALSPTAAPAAAGLPPWWMGITAISRDEQKAGRVLGSYNNSSKVLRRPKGPHNHILPSAVAAVIMTVAAGQLRDMTGIGQGMGIWCSWWARPASPSLPGCSSSAHILQAGSRSGGRARQSTEGAGPEEGWTSGLPGARHTVETPQLSAPSKMAGTCSRSHPCLVCSNSQDLSEHAPVLPPGTWSLGSASLRNYPEYSVVRPN